MLVSKQFFNEAASAWFRKAKLEFRSCDELDEFMQTLNSTPISAIATVGVTWACHKFNYGVFSPNLQWCTGLRRLKVTIKDGFETIEDKHDFVDGLDARDFKVLQIVHDISAIPSLKKIEIIPGQHKHVQTTQEREQYQRNVMALQGYIVSQVALRSAQPPTASGNGPSYYEETYSTPEIKKFAWIEAKWGNPKKAAALIRTAKQRGEERPSESTPVNTLAAQGDLILDMGDEDLVKTDAVAASESLCSTTAPSIQRGRTVTSDVGCSRIKKFSTRHRERNGSPREHRGPRITGMQMTLGGILFLNTACSMAALYFSIKS